MLVLLDRVVVRVIVSLVVEYTVIVDLVLLVALATGPAAWDLIVPSVVGWVFLLGIASSRTTVANSGRRE